MGAAHSNLRTKSFPRKPRSLNKPFKSCCLRDKVPLQILSSLCSAATLLSSTTLWAEHNVSPHSSPRHFMLFFLPAFNFVRIETPTLWAMIFLRHSAVCQWRPQSSELWSYLVYIRVYLFCFVLDREITGNSKASSFSSLSPLMESLTIHRESERLNNSGSRRPRFTSGRAWKRTFALRLRPESVGCP